MAAVKTFAEFWMYYAQIVYCLLYAKEHMVNQVFFFFLWASWVKFLAQVVTVLIIYLLHWKGIPEFAVTAEEKMLMFSEKPLWVFFQSFVWDRGHTIKIRISRPWAKFSWNKFSVYFAIFSCNIILVDLRSSAVYREGREA